MSLSDAERLAVLETQMTAVQATLLRIDSNIASLNKVAQRGNGAFHTILIIGGAIGWLGTVVIGIASMFRPH
jgi:hypothetical protein